MNMLAMERDTPSIPLDRLRGSKTQLMIGLSKLVENKGSALLMAIDMILQVVSLFLLRSNNLMIQTLQ